VPPEIIISVVSGVVALASAGLSLYGVRLANRLQAEREVRSKEQLVADVMARYRDPLLRAAFDLQSKLYNIATRSFLQRYYLNGNDFEREYALENTLYVLAQYLGWVELLRRDVQFLDLGDDERNKTLSKHFDAISTALLTDQLQDRTFRVFLGEQRAIGEIMLEDRTTADARLSIVGYATFVRKRQDAGFSHWFTAIEEDINTLSRESLAHMERVIRLQHSLIDLIDFLDPEAHRFLRSRRTKILLN
jgi:hypothetical protein